MKDTWVITDGSTNCIGNFINKCRHTLINMDHEETERDNWGHKYESYGEGFVG